MSKNKAGRQEQFRELKMREFSSMEDTALLGLAKLEDLSRIERIALDDVLRERGIDRAAIETAANEAELNKLLSSTNLGWWWLAFAFFGGAGYVAFVESIDFQSISMSSGPPVEGFADVVRIIGGGLAIVAVPLGLLALPSVALIEKNENGQPVFGGAQRVLFVTAYFVVLVVSGFIAHLLMQL